MTAGDLLLSCRASHGLHFTSTSTSFLFSLHRGHYSPLRFGKPSTIHFPENRHRARLVTLAFNFTSVFGSRGGIGDDVVTKILKENPTQVERQVLSGGKLVTFREKEVLENERKITNRFGAGISSILRLFRSEEEKKEEKVEDDISTTPAPVYLDNIFRDYKGKLYVPEQIFGENLSEEDEFIRDVKELPKMSIEDFDKFIRVDKIAMITSKSLVTNVPFHVGFCDYVVQLKESPGEKSLQKTKWTITLPERQSRDLLKKYTGPQYEIEKYTTSYVGNAVRHPHPVAAAISSRIISELGMLTALIATASVIVGGYVASVVFAVTSLFYAATLYIVWPLAKPLVKVIVGIASNAADRMLENVSDIISEGGIMTKLKEIYTLGGISTSLAMLGPVLLVFCTMVFVIRFTLSRRPKNFRQWDIWQGIEFGQSKPQARVDGSTGVMFSDVAGIDDAVEELQELVDYLKNPSLFDEKAIKPPHGVLLEGPPGCGKTLVAKAIAGEANVPFYQMAGSEFVEVLVGVGSARVRDLFKRAKVNKPSVVFIDEIDALATMRQGIFSESNDQPYNAATQERETTLNQLLIELDGFDSGKGVIFLGATNRRDLLDPALLRPGRFDRKISIRPPGAKGRLDILKVHARKVKMSPSVDLTTYAKNLPGWSGAKLSQLLQESALMAVRNKHESILQSDLDDAIDRLTVGPRCVGVELSYQGQCRRATTEVGTAITSHLLRRNENAKIEPCERISIIPRGQTYSQIIFTRLDDEAYLFERRPQLMHRLQVLLGGRAAEEVMYGKNTSKASLEYLSDASWLARKILCIWNMGDEIAIHGESPCWSRRAEFVGPRLDFEESLYRDYGFTESTLNFDLDDQIAQKTDKLINDMYIKILSMLRRRHAALVKTVKVLLDKKEIIGKHIDYIMNNYPADTSPDLVLEEKDPGSLPFFKTDNKEPQELFLSEESTLL